jgi:hypothetical protein
MHDVVIYDLELTCTCAISITHLSCNRMCTGRTPNGPPASGLENGIPVVAVFPGLWQFGSCPHEPSWNDSRGSCRRVNMDSPRHGYMHTSMENSCTDSELGIKWGSERQNPFSQYMEQRNRLSALCISWIIVSYCIRLFEVLNYYSLRLIDQDLRQMVNHGNPVRGLKTGNHSHASRTNQQCTELHE